MKIGCFKVNRLLLRKNKSLALFSFENVNYGIFPVKTKSKPTQALSHVQFHHSKWQNCKLKQSKLAQRYMQN